MTISGVARSGDMIAIMGPSGAGKSTLLNVLSGRIPVSSGTITLDNQPVTRQLRHKISYVLQQDYFYPNLTLRETLTFSAFLQLPDKMPADRKILQMLKIVKVLELGKCLDTKIGGRFVTGLSGGERKRASIACQLLSNPRIIILDEPTSGLDSAIAYSLMFTLSEYARKYSKTVISTIHQPSRRIFQLFTNILLITEGELAYFGTRGRILDFFSGIGLQCESDYNPADFILEQVKSDPKTVRKILKAANNLRKQSDWPEELKVPFDKSEAILSEGVETQGNQSKLEDIESGPTSISVPTHNDDVSFDEYIVQGRKYQAGFMMQFKTLSKRRFRQSIKGRLLSKLQWGQIALICLIAGLECFQTVRSEAQAQTRLGILHFFIVFFGFQPMMEAVFFVYDGSGVFISERASDLYSLNAYYLSLLVSEFPPLLIKVTISGTIYYWMTGLMEATGNFFAFLAILYLSAYTAEGMGVFVGTFLLEKSLLITTANTMTIAFLLVSGFYNNYVNYWFGWVRFLSYMTYSLNALGRVEFEYGTDMQCNPPTSSQYPKYCHNTTSKFPGLAFLELRNMDIPLYASIVIILLFIIAFRIAAYIVIRLYQPKV